MRRVEDLYDHVYDDSQEVIHVVAFTLAEHVRVSLDERGQDNAADRRREVEAEHDESCRISAAG